MHYSFAYITVPTKAEGKSIVLALLEEGLIACGNILPAAESYYVWEEKIERATEYIVILKTKPTHHTKIIRRVKELHSYECPCIVFLPIEDASSEFLNWLDQSC